MLHLLVDMDVVPSVNSQFDKEVEAILNAVGREKLLVLNPGSGFHFNVDKTSDTYEDFDCTLFVAFEDILKNNWEHAWPTYRFIPFHYKKKWFLTLAVSYRYLLLSKLKTYFDSYESFFFFV